MLDIKEVLLQWFINFFDKNTFGTHANKFGGAIKREILLKE